MTTITIFMSLDFVIVANIDDYRTLARKRLPHFRIGLLGRQLEALAHQSKRCRVSPMP